MKAKLIFLTFLIHCSQGFSQIHQWESIPTGTIQHLKSLSNLGENVLSVPGDGGVLLHYSTLSGDWTKIQLPTQESIVSADRIRFLSNQWKNILMTGTGLVYHLADSSTDFEVDTLPEVPTSSGVLHKLLNLNIANINEIRYGILYGNGQLMAFKFPYPTPRFDVTFSTQRPVSDLFAFNTWNILAAGDSGKIWKTVGLADPFQKVNQNLTTQKFNRIFGKGDQKIWIAGDSGTLLYSGNGGTSWSKIPVPSEENLLSGWKADSTLWLCGSGGTILYSTDDGQNWETETSGTNENLNDIRWFQNNMYCVGNRGTLLKLNLISSNQKAKSNQGFSLSQSGLRIKLKSQLQTNARLRIISQEGKIIVHQMLEPGQANELQMPNTGIFVIQMIEDSGKADIRKVILFP